MSESAEGRRGSGFVVRGPQDFFAGLAVVIVSCLVMWALSYVRSTPYQSISPTLFPRLCAFLLCFCGLILLARGLIRSGPSLAPLPLGGASLVTLGVVLFGALAPSVGYLIAGAVTVVIGGLGAKDQRLRDLLLLAAGLVVFSYLLFTLGLRLTLPVLPFLELN